MEIKVREVGEVESKSTQQEQELLDKHEAEVSGEQPAESVGLSEDDVRSFLSERYGREINSDELNGAGDCARAARGCGGVLVPSRNWAGA